MNTIVKLLVCCAVLMAGIVILLSTHHLLMGILLVFGAIASALCIDSDAPSNAYQRRKPSWVSYIEDGDIQ